MTDAAFFPDDLLKDIRDRFYYVESDPDGTRRTFLESASGSLRLKSVVEAMSRHSMVPDQLGRASSGSRQAGEVMDRGVEDVRLFVGAISGTIMPALSSTHAVFRVVNAVLGSSPGTNVVTTDLEHPSVYDSTERFAEVYGKERRVAHVDSNTGSVSPDSVLDLVDRHTALICLIHASNVTGAIVDVKTIASEARKISPDVYVMSDGVQYAPHAPLDVEDLGVDAYIFAPYKAFCVKGIAFGYLSDRLARLDHWALSGKDPTDWTLGSAEQATYAAWSAVVDYLAWLGVRFTEANDRRTRVLAAMNASEAHVSALLKRVLNGSPGFDGLLQSPHVKVHGFIDDSSRRACLLLFNLDRMDSHQGVDLYDRAGIRVHNRVRDAYSSAALDALGVSEGIRLSACHYNTPDEIDAFLKVTANLGRVSDEEIASAGAQVSAGGRSEG